MTDSNVAVAESGLTADEQAYFDSFGENAPKTEVAEAQPAPVEVVEAEDDGDEQPDSRTRTVPHGALHAEREKRKAIEAKLREIETQKAVLEDRWNTILKLQQQEAKPAAEETKAEAQTEDPMPDPDQDIFAFAKWQQRRLEKFEAELRQRAEAEKRAQETTQAERQIWSRWEADTASFKAQKPDFTDAAAHLAALRDKALARNAVFDERFANKAFRDQVVNQELAGIVAQAAQKGLNAAQIIYDYAIDYGYTPKQAEPAAPVVPQMPENLAKVAEAQEAAKSLSQTGGKGASGPLSPEDLLAMSAEEFDRWSSDPKNQKLWKKMMGG